MLEQQNAYQPTQMLPHDKSTVPVSRMLSSLPLRGAALRDLDRRSRAQRGFFALPGLKRYVGHTSRYLAWQQYRIAAILLVAFLGLPLLGWAWWWRRGEPWRAPLGIVSLAAIVGTLGFFPAGSSLPTWLHVVFASSLVPAALLLTLGLATFPPTHAEPALGDERSATDETASAAGRGRSVEGASA
jgi:hypothetical protein